MSRKVIFTSGDVARALDLSRERVRQLVALGRLRPLALTVRGLHLFASEDVERLRDQRERERRAVAVPRLQ